MPQRAQIIPPDAYPPLIRKGDSAAVARALRSSEVTERGNKAIAEQSDSLRVAVLAMVGEIEKSDDDEEVARLSHDIRGLAEPAGLAAAGRIAEGLCRYFHEIGELGLGPDPAILSLHVTAMALAARHDDEAARMSDQVAKELAVLVARKLTEIKILLHC